MPMQKRDFDSPPSRAAMTRRRFMIDSAKGAAAVGMGSASSPSAGRAAEASTPKRRVVIVTHPNALIKDHQADPAVLSKMVEAGIKALTGKQSDKQAWQQIAQPAQRVTMKWNEMGWRPIRTHPELRSVVGDALVRHGGLEPAKVVEFSRTDVKGEASRIVKIPIPGRPKPAKLRRIITDFTDCLINLPVLKTHNGKGVCISLKNHFGSIANPSDFHGWSRGMGKSIVDLNLFPAIKDRTRLIICDALRPQWDHGPLHAPGCRWNLNVLIFAFDTVAIDAVGTDLLEKKRKTIDRLRRKWQLLPAREMLAYGQEKDLGIADLSRIEVEEIALKS